MDFSAFVGDIRNNQWPVHGVQVYEKDCLTHEFGDTKTRYPIYSCTKTILSLAVGMAVDDGKMDIHQPLLRYLPEKAVREMDEKQRAVYAALPVERLMCMSVSGYPFRLSGQENWLQEALAYPISPERAFDYANPSAYLVGVAATQALQEDVFSFLERRLLAPLGIDHPCCERCSDGYFYGATGMSLSVEELSRIGMLLYHKGEYKGERLVSRAYVEQMTALQQPAREGGYGYFLWQYRDGFSINGKWGQKCYILPKQEIMITFLSHWPEDTLPLKLSMEKHLL